MNKMIKVMLLCAILIATGYTGLTQSIQFRFRDTSAAVNAFIDVPVYSTSSLDNRGILSYSLKYSYNSSILAAQGVVVNNTLAAPFGTPTYNTSTPGVIIIAAAGTAPLSGSGIFLYLRFKIIGAGGSTLVNSGASSNYFNEGDPAISYTNSGIVSGIAPPTITVSPNTSTILKGESQQFIASGGSAPYSWTSTNSTVAAINSTGLLTGNQIGFTNVKATDANGNSGQVNNVEVRGYRLRIPDTTGIYNNYINIPVSTTDLSGLNILSGQFTITYNGAYINDVSIVTNNSILQSVSNVVSNLNNPNVIQLSFVNNTSVNGSGVLFWIRGKLSNGSGGSSFISITNSVLNEDLLALIKNGSLSYPQPANLTISSSSNQLVFGDSLRFTVSNNAVAPYTWSVSNPALATISSTGYLKVLQSGQVTVKVTDANNAVATSASIQLYDTYLKIADSNAVTGTQVGIPVSIKALPAGMGIVSMEGRIYTSNPQLFQLQDIDLSGTPASSFSKSISIGSNYIQFALAGSTPITGNMVLFKVKGLVSSSLPLGTTSTLSFQNLTLNEGQPLPLIQTGIVKSIAPPVTYTFLGTGSWNVASNWANNMMPPSGINPQDEIIIDPAGNGECVLDVSQPLSTNAKVIVKAGKTLKILGSLNITK